MSRPGVFTMHWEDAQLEGYWDGGVYCLNFNGKEVPLEAVDIVDIMRPLTMALGLMVRE